MGIVKFFGKILCFSFHSTEFFNQRCAEGCTSRGNSLTIAPLSKKKNAKQETLKLFIKGMCVYVYGSPVLARIYPSYPFLRRNANGAQLCEGELLKPLNASRTKMGQSQ